MKSNLSALTVVAFFITMSFTSCKNKELLLDIKFGLTEFQTKKEIIKLVKNNDITMQVQNSDTTYFRNLEINSSTYKCQIYFNDDRLKTGKLRLYDYSLTILPYSETGNDTLTEDIYKVNQQKVFKTSDFENLKSHLDKNYGAGIVQNDAQTSQFSTSYKYITKEADLYLVHGKKEDGDFYGTQIKIPFYDVAYIQIKSKSYEQDFKLEKEKKIKMLTPEKILSISFEAPSLINDIDEFGNIVSKITLLANSENYLSWVLDEDIIECKGILSVTDTYNDTLKSAELIYKFSTPLTSPTKQEWRTIDYNSYSIKNTDPTHNKIINMMKAGSTLKAKFKPTAVVLESGNVIK